MNLEGVRWRAVDELQCVPVSARVSLAALPDCLWRVLVGVSDRATMGYPHTMSSPAAKLAMGEAIQSSQSRLFRRSSVEH
jgi:hypothetical protein